MLPRRRSLQTILYLSEDLAKWNVSIDLKNFRGCTYCGAMPNGVSWNLPQRLDQNRRKWSVYQRNELLSLAIQGIFYALLDAYQEINYRFHTVDELIRWFVNTPEVDNLKEVFRLNARFRDWFQVGPR